jgi:hypothetical protein
MNRKTTRPEGGFALAFTLIFLLPMILLMFVVTQLLGARYHSINMLYLTYQTADVGNQNIPYPDDALGAALWVPILAGYSGVTKLASGTLSTSQALDANNDGANDTTLNLAYSSPAGLKDLVSATYVRNDNFLSGMLNVLAPITMQAKVESTGENTLYNLAIDITTRTRGQTLSISNLYANFGVVEGGGGDPFPLTDAKKLPYYLTGDALYVNSGGVWTQKCASRIVELGLYANQIAVDIELPPYSQATTPSGRNGWCTNPWATQKVQLQNNMSDYFIAYKEAMQVLMQVLNQAETSVRLSAFGAPTTGGAITETEASGQPVSGDFEIADGTGDLYASTIDMSTKQAKTGASAVGGCGGIFNFTNPMPWHPGALKRAMLRGRVDNPYDQMRDTVYQNSGQGVRYLSPLPYPALASFPWDSCQPYDFSGAAHPLFSGSLPLNGTWGTSGLEFPVSGVTTVAARSLTWPDYKDVDGTTGALLGSNYANVVQDNYAPCVFSALTPMSGGRDLRSVFQNALDRCNSYKTTNGVSTPCGNVVVAHGVPDLGASGAVPSCTTATTLSYAAHLSAISTDLVAYDALANTFTILIFIDDGLNDATEKAQFLALFDNDTYPDRFLLPITVPSPESGIRTQLLSAVEAVSLLMRESGIYQK